MLQMAGQEMPEKKKEGEKKKRRDVSYPIYHSGRLMKIFIGTGWIVKIYVKILTFADSVVIC